MMDVLKSHSLYTGFLLFISTLALAQQQPIKIDKGEKISYAADSLGNRMPDYSFAGYRASEVDIPTPKPTIFIKARAGDQRAEIQSALDAGGIIQLGPGVFHVNGTLSVTRSNTIIRGSGTGQTKIIAEGLRETLFRVIGGGERNTESELRIAESYTPVNAKALNLSNNPYKVGEQILVHRSSNAKWIKLLKTEEFGGGISALGWKPGQRDIFWDRTIVASQGNTITLDAPLTCALDTNYGEASVSRYNWAGRISEIGIENLSLDSRYDLRNPKDEEHCWMAITMEKVRDAWVRQVNFSHFAGSAVMILETASRITVEDCISRSPISEIGGQRRYTFFTSGQQTLFQRCYAENGYHDFGTGYMTPGPTAFVQCYSSRPYSFSGTVDSWATGVLFDVFYVDGQAISIMNRGQDDQGAGWTGANCTIWQSSASRIDNYAPPGAMNYAYGCWAQFSGDGYWEASNESVRPRSLFYAQLAQRLGDAAARKGYLMPVSSEASSSPSIDVAAALTKDAYQPVGTMLQWIQNSSKRNPIPVSAVTATKGITPTALDTLRTDQNFIQLVNGRLISGRTLMNGMRTETPWWNGSVRPQGLTGAKPHITRFVPGRTGRGLTDDLDSLTDEMSARHLVGLEHNYALWYDRRRDDHERVRRMNGEVWPPFYEVPFERTGKDTAWDGLSKYDLTNYNQWYWSRLKQFAKLADDKGLVLIHQNFFQHNIIEAGAHYVDFAWRPVNNLNNTGFPEPVNFAGDKRIFMAEQFYDLSNPTRKKLLTAYIEQCLNAFSGSHNVIQFIGAEFTGPLHFTRFWLDVVGAWEKKTGKNALIALSVTKDVQDSILKDPKRAAVVDIVDIRQWFYREDGSAYAPLGGQNLAPRQHARLTKPGKTSFDQVYKAVREYREKGKAVIYSSDNYPQYGWAAFMAGGSLPNLPAGVDNNFLNASISMNRFSRTTNYVRMEDGRGNSITYFLASAPDADLPAGITAKKKDLLNLRGENLGPTDLKTFEAGQIVWIHN